MYDFTHIWGKKQKVTSEKTKPTGNNVVVTEGKRGVGENQEGKGG